MDDQRRRESELEKWLTFHGVYLAASSSWGAAPHPLGIATTTKDQDLQPSGRGLLATRGVRQGDPLFRVPEKVCITRRNAKTVLGEEVATDALGEHETLALLLMVERSRGDASFWAPYLDVLPRTVGEVNTPATATTTTTPTTTNTPATATTATTTAAATATTTTISNTTLGLASKEEMGMEQFEWAMMILFSRAINMRAMDALVLAPYADLLNHSPASNAIFEAEKTWMAEGYEIVCYADRMYGQMEQVYLSYGKRSNQELLLLYGFVIDRNPFDEVVLRVAIDPELTPRFAEKSAFLKRGGRKDSLSFPLRVDRFPDELIHWEAARAAVVDACAAALSNYPRTIEEDRKLIADKACRALLGDKQYMALRLCMNEKGILERAVRAVNALEW
ncbi:hypothetical protein T492DRAFT_1005533 [Pavlovales sp. CCMP2436]|nr:hypothetical protein T492DRAFT_1005533 [Pavlovales sp. CCMP2436]